MTNITEYESPHSILTIGQTVASFALLTIYLALRLIPVTIYLGWLNILLALGLVMHYELPGR